MANFALNALKVKLFINHSPFVAQIDKVVLGQNMSTGRGE